MKLRYFGHACFELVSRNGARLFTDPYTGVGYELPSGLSADVVTVSHGHFDHNATHKIRTKRVLSSSGRFAVADFCVEGILSYHDEKKGALRGENILYKITADGVTVCHMGDIGEPCRKELVEKIGEVDVLLLPVGGNYTVDAQGAKAYVDAIAPKVVIPMHFKPQDGSLDIADPIAFLRLFERVEKVSEAGIELTPNTKGVFYVERTRKS